MYPDAVVARTARALYRAQDNFDTRRKLTLEEAYRADAVAVLDALDDLGVLDLGVLEQERPGGVVDSST